MADGCHRLYFFTPKQPGIFFKKLTLLPPLGLVGKTHSGEFARPSEPSPVKHRCISANAPKKARFAFRRKNVEEDDIPIIPIPPGS